MEIKAVLLARIIGLFDINELDPNGSVFFPSLVQKITDRFSFVEFPSSVEELDEAKGISFRKGYYNGQAIDELKIFNDGLTLETRSSTEEAKELLLDALKWMKVENGITFDSSMISRWRYLSNLVFTSKADLDLLSPALRALAASISGEVKKVTQEDRNFHVAGVMMNFERLGENSQTALFTIERRAKEHFAKEKYFSAAPLSTRVHIQLLEQFERDVLQAHTAD